MSVTSTLETITEESLSHGALVRNFKMSAVLQSFLCTCHGVGMHHEREKGPVGCVRISGWQRGRNELSSVPGPGSRWCSERFYSQVSKEESRIEFQQDSAASHHSKSTMQWFHQNQILLFYHPSCSPDLSPIEPVWLELKTHLQALPHLPTTVAQLIRL